MNYSPRLSWNFGIKCTVEGLFGKWSAVVLGIHTFWQTGWKSTVRSLKLDGISTGFMQSSSSTMFPTFPSGSPRGSSLATLFCQKTHLMSATFTSMSPTTGKPFTHTSRCVFTGNSSSSLIYPVGSQVAERGHGMAVWGQWEQQHGGGHRISATGTAAGSTVSVHLCETFV